MLIGYDYEVFRYNWLICAIDPEKDEPYIIWDDPEKLAELYDQYKEDIWVGFNSRHYDQYIQKAILCGLSAWECNDWIINKHQPGWSFSSLLKQIFMINYDVMPLNSSLKQLEGFQGHNIHESSVDFRIDRPLTEAEKRETEKYCLNDVTETLNVFLANINDFNALLWLVKEYKFPLSYMNKTKAQISAEILGCEPKDRDDEWDLSILPCIQLQDKKRWLTIKRKKKKGEPSVDDKRVGKVFMRPDEWFLTPKYQDYRLYFETEVAGVEHTLAWGGVHGGLKKYHYKCDKDHLMIHVDVASYYLRLMIFHNLLTRNAKYPERFRQIYERRIELKHAGKKKEQAPLKIVINGTYGICKDPQNKAYDPRNANLVCINGQLMLLDLIEHLEAVESFELIQSNTDGLIIKIHRKDFDKVDDICYEWESRCNMELEFDYISEIWQGDVNNYVFKQFDGKIERKGAYVKELSSMDNDLPIINKAILDLMLKGIPIEQTINECNELVMFQKICKLTSNYSYVTWNDKKYFNKCYRVFASKNSCDGPVKKIKEDGRADKFATTSANSFIENGDLNGVKVPMRLDKNWYIEEAKKRAEKFCLV
jgi:DNA polymerase